MILDRWVSQEVRGLYRIDAAQHILSGLFYGMTIVLLPVVARRAGASSFQTVLIGSSFGLGCLLANLWARRSMRGRRMRFILTVRATGRLLLLGLLLTDDMWWFCGVICVVEIFEIATQPAQLDIQKTIFPHGMFGRVIAFLMMEFHLALSVGAVLGGYLIEYPIPGMSAPLGFSVVLMIGSVFGLLSVYVYSRLPFPDDLPLIPVPESSTQKKGRWLTENPLFRHGLVLHLWFGTANLLAMGLYYLYLVDRAGGTESSAGYLMALFTLSTALFSFLWAKWADRIHVLRMLTLVIVACIATTGAFFLASSPWELIPAYLLWGVVNAGSIVVPVKLTSLCAGPGEVQRYWSIFLVWLGFRTVAAPLVAAEVYRRMGRFDFIFLFSVVVMMGALIYNERVLRRPEFHKVVEGDGSV